MNAPVSTPVELQADALVEEVERKLAERQRELNDAAEREADEIRRRARVKARRQMRRAIEEMRAAERQRTLQLRAELETESRRQASLRALEALASAWPRLAGALERRWGDAAARARWLAAQIALARSRLPPKGWVLRHPQAWGPAETLAVRAMLQAQGVADATLRSEPGQRVGLVIEADGARLDSTPQALLADRPLVESVLLARLEPGAPTEACT